jgi:hypothetical protein
MGIVIRQQSTPSAKRDGYLDSLSKLIPGEALVGYTTALQLAELGEDLRSRAILLSLFAALTPLLLFLSARRAGTPATLLQYAVRTAAFVITALKIDEVIAPAMGDLRWIPSVGGIVVLALATYLVTPPEE